MSTAWMPTDTFSDILFFLFLFSLQLKTVVGHIYFLANWLENCNHREAGKVVGSMRIFNHVVLVPMMVQAGLYKAQPQVHSSTFIR